MKSAKHQLILSYHYHVLKYSKQTKMWLMISDLSCHTTWLDYIATFHSAKQSISKIWDTSSCKSYVISTIYIYIYIYQGWGQILKKKQQLVQWHGRFHSTSTLLSSRFHAIFCNWYVPIQSPALAAKKQCFLQPFMKTEDFSNLAWAFTPWVQRCKDF